MADDLDLDQLEENINNNNRGRQRLKDLSERLINSKKQLEERDNLLKEKEVALTNASKERDFYSKFSDSTAKYQGANEYKDKILEKVKAGYDVEDATISVLAKEGKLPMAQPAVVETEVVAGGSATTAMKGDGTKPLSEMSRQEKREAILSGDPAELERVLRHG
jgi:hypothetical protein